MGQVGSHSVGKSIHGQAENIITRRLQKSEERLIYFCILLMLSRCYVRFCILFSAVHATGLQAILFYIHEHCCICSL